MRLCSLLRWCDHALYAEQNRHVGATSDISTIERNGAGSLQHGAYGLRLVLHLGEICAAWGNLAPDLPLHDLYAETCNHRGPLLPLLSQASGIPDDAPTHCAFAAIAQGAAILTSIMGEISQ